MLEKLLNELEEVCHHCEGNGYTEVYSEQFLDKVSDLELLYPSYEQALIIARDKYVDEISHKTCPYCNGLKVIPNQNGKILISNKDKVVQFLRKQNLL
ncbi:hypothetical protein [Salirhabdus sp. Marseille-P4669]|uniref:hypothetical protein n=1 Tax=Salirhabdus sp. Marseille-P4669 TaxID=2042310 RepID=UPI000C7AE5C5|nr:hypothetical protein [Salirhabdus sp. Marseille-P4669]